MIPAAPAEGLSLAAKLIIGFLLVAVPSLAVGAAISVYSLRDLDAVNRELQEISRSLEAVRGVDAAVARAVMPLSAFLVDGAPAHAARFDAAIREVEMRLRGCTGSSCHGSSGPSTAMAASLAPFVQGIRERAAPVFRDPSPPGDPVRVRALHDIGQQGEEANVRLARMSAALLQRVTTLQEKSQSVSARATVMILAASSGVLVLAALSAWLLSHRLMHHVRALLTGTRKLTQGSLEYRIPAPQPDEIGQLARSFNAMAQEIQDHRAQLERRVAERTTELRQAQASLVQSEKLASIGLLAAGVAHELNNPLTSILMNVSLLTEDATDRPALRAELQRIGEDTLRCKRIIDDLRDFSRRQELDAEPCDINALVDDALARLKRRSGLQGIEVAASLTPGLAPVRCDPARMEQVFANVLANATQAMPQGGRLAVTTALRDQWIEIALQDTGPGIPEAVLSRVFDPFFTTKPQGTGLGLSIVYRIMEAHGGRVEIENVAPRSAGAKPPQADGVRVRLLLPATAPGAGDAGTQGG